MNRAKRERIRQLVQARERGDTEYLIRALLDPEQRSMAASYLAKTGSTDAIPPLVRLLNAYDPQARAAAARALGKLGVSDAVPELMRLAEHDSDLAVRTHSIRALEEIGATASTPLLIQLLDDPNWLVRDGAIRALGTVADARAIAPLTSAAAKRPFFRRRAYRRAIDDIQARSTSPPTLADSN